MNNFSEKQIASTFWVPGIPEIDREDGSSNVSLRGWCPPTGLYHNVVTQNTTITTYTESEKLKACNVKRKDS
jgi:hypothetical protein